MKTSINTKLLKHLSGIAIAMTALCCTPALLAQSVSGSISGEVTDSSGAVIVGAHVAVENAGTGVKTESTTNAAGAYTIRFLPVGTYRVTVTAPGFSSQTVTPFALEINQTAKINASLKVGASSTIVEVQDIVTPILNTNDGSLGIALCNNEIATIPLNGRNFSCVTLFQPGAINTDPQGLTGYNAIERSTYNNGIVSINGNRNQANNYTLDGVDMNEGQNNLIAYNPAPDATSRSVISANAPAEYGNVNGGDVLMLKCGTNQYHGSAYAFLENENLNANTWVEQVQNPDRSSKSVHADHLRRHLGGPIMRDKLFFFVDYEACAITPAVPLPPAFFQRPCDGDFSALHTLSSNSIQLYDTQNGFAPYVGDNRLPILNPVATYLFAHPRTLSASERRA